MRAMIVIVLVNLSLGAVSFAEDTALRAFELRMAGKVDEAKTLLEQTVKDNPKDARVWFELARTSWHQWPVTHNFAGAARAIDKACQLDAKNSRYWLWAGYIHTYNSIAQAHSVKTWLAVPGQMKIGARHCEKALALDPNCHAARNLVYSLYDNNPWYLGGSKKKAKQHLKQLKLLSPIDAAKLTASDIPYAKQKERLNVWLPFLQTHPSDPNVHEALCNIYLRLDDFTKAQAHANKAIESDATKRVLLIKLANHLRGKDADLAEELIQRYLAYEDLPIPLRAYALGQLARVYEQQGHTQKAVSTKAEAQMLDKYTWQTCPDVLDLFTVAP